MDVRLPDGTIIRNVPEGTTRAQLIERMRGSGMPIPAEWLGEVKAVEKKMDPTEGMSATDLFLAGTGKAMTDLGRGIGQMFGLVSREDVARARELDKPLMESKAAIAGNITGNIAAAVPTALIPGANTIAGGAAVGGLLGLAQPSISTDETLTNVAGGGIAGAAFPFLSRVYKTGKAMAEPFYESGKQRIVGRALREAAGSQADDVMRNLDAAAQPMVGPQPPEWTRRTMGELVPDSLPTVAEVSGSPGVAALQRAAMAANPEVTNQVALRGAANNEARRSALAAMAGEDGARDFARANLEATADQLYGAARRAGVPQLTDAQLQNVAKFMQRVPPSIIDRAKELARINGMAMDDTTSLQGMHWVKTAIDDAIGKAKAGGDREFARALTGLQKDLLSGIDALNPAYKAARQTFASMAKPVNEMDTIAAILDKATPNKLTQTVQPRAFANALSDKTARQATGFQGATLEGTLANTTLNRLDAILEDLARVDFAQNAGRGAGSDTVQKLAYSNILEQAGVPTFLREIAPAQVAGNVLARGADAAYARANRELSQKLAEIMLDPAQAAEVMRKATPAQRVAIQRALDNMGLLGSVVRASPRIGLLSLPATAPVAANAVEE